MRDFFEEHLRPWLLHRAMSHGPLHPYRERVVGQARGRVLEIGVGSGLNLPYFGSEVDALVGLDPSRPLLDRARAAAARLSVPAEFIEGLAEELPFEDRSFDTALCTFTLCSVTDPARVLDELRRVLRPNGRLLFVEHGRAPERSVAAWQDRLAPCWCRLSGGCHLNRAPLELLAGAGFQLEGVCAGYLHRPKVVGYLTEGCARRGGEAPPPNPTRRP